MDKNYYKQYYEQERKHWWFKVRASILMDTIDRYTDSIHLKILNIGSATHMTSDLLTKFGEVTSLEYDKDCCRFVREELKKEVINGSATELPFEDNSFDLVCAFDVIEHIEDDRLAVREIERVSRIKEGIVFLTVPAFMFLWSDHDEINHHYRRYTLPQLCSKISTSSKILKKSYFNFFLFPLIGSFRLLSRLKKRNGPPKSDFDNINPNPLLNRLFGMIFKLEYLLLKVLRFPFGVSILLMYKPQK